MQKIEPAGWSAGISLVSFGVRIGIRVNDPAVLERLGAHLPPGATPLTSPLVDYAYSLHLGAEGTHPGEPNSYALYLNARRITQSMNLDAVLDYLESDLHFRVAVGAPRHLFVHAGVVAWRGRALVIPGKSMSGKTSLVAALVRAGATYYSDEFAVMDTLGRIHPYPKPLFIREGNSGLRKKLTAEQMGGTTGTEPLEMGLVVFTGYRPGARWRPRALTPGEALLALLEHTVVAQINPDLALATLERAVIGAAAIQSKREEAETVAVRLLNYLDANPNPVELENEG